MSSSHRERGCIHLPTFDGLFAVDARHFKEQHDPKIGSGLCIDEDEESLHLVSQAE